MDHAQRVRTKHEYTLVIFWVWKDMVMLHL